MNNHVVSVTVPEPHDITPGGPEWKFTGIFGDDMRVAGTPSGEDAPATVALLVTEDIEPFHEVTAYYSPQMARQIAGAMAAAANHAEDGNGDSTAGGER